MTLFIIKHIRQYTFLNILIKMGPLSEVQKPINVAIK